MAFSRLRRVPLVLLLQDILPDGATASGVLEEGGLIEAARRFERAAYRASERIVVISETFRENLLAKEVPADKLVRVYNPTSRPVRKRSRPASRLDLSKVLSMGNIGHTQNLAAMAQAFESEPALEALDAKLVIAGDGVAAEEVRAAIRTPRVQMAGLLSDEELERELMTAAVGLVSQSYVGTDFNVPSKLMNFMGYGIPVLAAVSPGSEAARIVNDSGGGWVASSPEEGAATLARVLADPEVLKQRGKAGLAFAKREFAPGRVAEQVEAVLLDAAQPNRAR
jgi:colanic acid biosynthesis glycosyl transferase WcaI